MCSSGQGSAEKRGRAASSWKSCPCRRGEPAGQASVRQGTARHGPAARDTASEGDGTACGTGVAGGQEKHQLSHKS